MARDLTRTVRGWCAYFSYGSVTTARHNAELHLSHGTTLLDLPDKTTVGRGITSAAGHQTLRVTLAQ